MKRSLGIHAQAPLRILPGGLLSAQRVMSIIVGAAIGAVFFKERFGRPRIAAAGLLVAGIGLMLRAG